LKEPETGENVDLKMDMAMKVQMAGLQSGDMRYKAESAVEFMGMTGYSTIF